MLGQVIIVPTPNYGGLIPITQAPNNINSQRVGNKPFLNVNSESVELSLTTCVPGGSVITTKCPAATLCMICAAL